MGVVVTGTISQTSPLDTYPTHDAAIGLGGKREVIDVAARNNIPVEQRTFGMLVTCNADGTPANNVTFILANVALGGTNNTLSDNANWIDFLGSSGGITSLNGLAASSYPSQLFATGTSGTDFAIVSATGTHTFNLPVASSSNTGKLSNTDWSAFNSKVGGSGTLNYIPKFTPSGVLLGDSSIQDVAGVVTMGANFTWTPTTGLLNLKHMGVGANSSISDQYMLHVNETTAAVSPIGVYSDLTHTSTSLATSIIGISSRVTQSGGASLGGLTAGISSELVLNSAVNFPSNTVNGLILSAQSTASQTGTIATYSHQLFYTPVWTGSKPTTMYGSYYQNIGHSGTTNSCAIYIAAQSGSTNNYGIVSLAQRNGFGIATPTSTVHIFGEGPSNATTCLYAENSVGDAYLRFGNSGIIEHRPNVGAYNFISYQPNGTAAIQFYTQNSGSGNQLIVSSGGLGTVILSAGSADSFFNNTGNFGIGTDSPTRHFNFKGRTTDNTVGFELKDSANIQTFFVQNNGYVVQRAINSAIPNTDLVASQLSWYINEAGNLLICKVKYADGTTVKTTSLALT